MLKTNPADKLKELRKELGMTQEEMAYRLHRARETYAKMEAGKSEIGVWELKIILEMFGESTDDFWTFYLDSADFETYRLYRNALRKIKDKDFLAAKEMTNKIKRSKLSKKLFFRQFVLFVDIVASDSDAPEESEKRYLPPLNYQ